jgi:hypothetical protein
MKTGRPLENIVLFLVVFDQECQRMSQTIAENRLAYRLGCYERAVQADAEPADSAG